MKFVEAYEGERVEVLVVTRFGYVLSGALYEGTKNIRLPLKK